MASSPKVKRTTKHGDGAQNLLRSQKDAYARLLNQHQNGKFRSYLQEIAKQQVEDSMSTSVSRSVNVLSRRKKGNSESSYSVDSLSSQQSRQVADASICLYMDKTNYQVTCTEDQGIKSGMLEKHDRMELHKAAAPKKVHSKPQHKRNEKDIKMSSDQVGSEEGDSQQLRCSRGEEQAKNKSKKKRLKGNLAKKDQGECGREVDLIAGKSPNENKAPQSQASKESLPQNNKDKGTKGGRGSWKQLFEQYILKEDVSAGLERGELIKGVLRINPKKYKEAFVPSPDGSADIFLDGIAARNRALNGDVVVVKVLPPEQWKAVSGDINERTLANQMVPKASDVIEEAHYNEDDEVIGKMKKVCLQDEGVLLTFQRFVKELQHEKPMVHLLHVVMVALVRELLSKFMRPKAIPLSHKEILKVDVRSRDLQLSNQRLSVGQFCYNAMNKARVERKVWVGHIYDSLREGYMRSAEFLLKNLPLDNIILTSLSALTPSLIQFDAVVGAFTTLGEALPNVRTNKWSCAYIFRICRKIFILYTG
ncbi:uncharacterized protein LOC113045516 [Carassius auratus]|uniref:Uncharacterized protein LOC113045516 n=1 Tax=Carassius auratus TaxID=7957 RepID=A0A6P6JPD7_CARAU|nr:uncharacterized protein LOC113045516 [Carassius auratus]